MSRESEFKKEAISKLKAGFSITGDGVAHRRMDVAVKDKEFANSVKNLLNMDSGNEDLCECCGLGDKLTATMETIPQYTEKLKVWHCGHCEFSYSAEPSKT